MGKILVTMSGGTTTVNNSVLAGILQEARASSRFSGVITGVPGIVGASGGHFSDFTDISDREIELLSNSPGSASIGTTRTAPLSEAQLSEFRRQCMKRGVEFFVNIGGNGTIKQTIQISSRIPELKVAAAPKTVDNDLGDAEFKDVLFTPGFPSCVNYWCQKLTLLNNESIGASSHDKVIVAQTFGRETGFIAGGIRFADPARSLPLLILLPEDPQPLENLFKKTVETISRFGRAIIVTSEGYPVGDIGSAVDATGQTMYGSSRGLTAQVIVSYLMSRGIQSRSYIPTIDQRQDPLSRTTFDVAHAVRVGRDLVRAFCRDESGFFIGTSGTWGEGHFVSRCIPLLNIRQFSRRMPMPWIRSGDYDVSDEYIRYLGKCIGEESLTFGKRYYGQEMFRPCSVDTTTSVPPPVREDAWIARA